MVTCKHWGLAVPDYVGVFHLDVSKTNLGVNGVFLFQKKGGRYIKGYIEMENVLTRLIHTHTRDQLTRIKHNFKKVILLPASCLVY